MLEFFRFYVNVSRLKYKLFETKIRMKIGVSFREIFFQQSNSTRVRKMCGEK